MPTNIYHRFTNTERASLNSMNTKLPSYLENAKPRPQNERTPWYTNIAPAYAGIFLWFVFWQDIVNSGTVGGALAYGLWLPIISLIAVAGISYALFYFVPASFGMKSGYGLTVVGSSIFGRTGGVVMPGLLMGLLQFGWLAVNIYFASKLICGVLTFIPLWLMIVIEGVLATFIGLKGIKYVAKVSTYLPIIPLAILAILLFSTAGSLGDFNESIFVGDKKATPFSAIDFIVCYIVGFFATAGVAGTDFGTNARGMSDVRRGGIFGIFLAIVLTAGASILIVAGAYGNPETAKAMLEAGTPMNATEVMNFVMGSKIGGIMMMLLAVAAFPSACFASVIASDSFKTAMPNVNANLSVSFGGAIATILALSGVAGKAAAVFAFIGASFAPIIGAMCAEYIIAKGDWKASGENFNKSGWLAWAIGFVVGVMPNFNVAIPLAPLVAWAIGFAIYFVSEKVSRRHI